MTRQRIFGAAVVAVLLGSGGLTLSGAGQGAASPQDDVLAALLVEVRGLRAAMEQMASAGPRIQLALGRLQMQEQRINTMLRRQDELTARIPSLDQQIEAIKHQMADREAALAIATPPEVRAEIEKELPRLKAMLDQLALNVGQLRAEEAQIAASISAEQNRWIEINGQLEDLERSLREVGKR